MLLPHLEPVVPAVLEFALDDVFLQEVSHLFSEKYLLLNLNWIVQILILKDLLSGFNAGLMEHLVVAIEGFHHGFQKATIELEGGLMSH